MPPGVDSNEVTRYARERYNLILGGGIGELSGTAIRLGHLGSLNELEVLAMIGGTELAFADLGVPVEPGSGLLACQQSLVREQVPQLSEAALVAASA
jgi:alanine-glyoxylate transaminase/serine-glyoxylate transaminase/serine-pyruvate transaminase